MNARSFWAAAKILLGAIILYLLFKKIGITPVVETISSMQNPVLYLLVGFLLIIAGFVLGAMCLYLLITPIKKISLFKLFKYSSISWAAGAIIPTADIVSISYLLKKEGIDWGPGLAINFLDKAITMAVLAGLSILAALKFLPASRAVNLIITVSVLFLIGILAISSLGRTAIRRWILRKYSEHFVGFWRVLKWFLLNKKIFLAANMALTLLKFLVTAAITYILFISLGILVPMYDIALITATILVIRLIPSPLNFIGIRDAVGFSLAVFFYAQIGVSAPVVVGTYIIVFALSYLYALLTLIFVDYRPLMKLPKI